jgi:hypothetical protein
MKRHAGVMALALVLAFGLGLAYADDPVGRTQTGPVSPDRVKGEILKVDGEFYVIKDDLTGKDIKFAIEKDTQATLARPLEVGDQIDAQLTPEGFAKSVTLVAQSKKQQDKMEQRSKDQTGPKDLGTIQAPGTIEGGNSAGAGKSVP